MSNKKKASAEVDCEACRGQGANHSFVPCNYCGGTGIAAPVAWTDQERAAIEVVRAREAIYEAAAVVENFAEPFRSGFLSACEEIAYRLGIPFPPTPSVAPNGLGYTPKGMEAFLAGIRHGRWQVESAAPAVEPVAWKLSYAHPRDATLCGSSVYTSESKALEDQAEDTRNGFVSWITPLYTHPAAAPSEPEVSEAMVDAAMKAYENSMYVREEVSWSAMQSAITAALKEKARGM